MPNYQSIYEGSQHDMYVTKAALIDLIYPVGAIYISYTNVDPSNIFGGTWEEITGRFLLARDDLYVAQSTGGEAKHILTTYELPVHAHGLNNHTHGPGSYATNTAGSHSHQTVMGMPNPANWVADGTSNYGATEFTRYGQTASAGNHSHRVDSGTSGAASGNTDVVGAGAAHNNMPPYLVVYMYRRIS